MKNPKDLLTPSKSDSQVFSDLIHTSTEGLKKYYLMTTALEIELFKHTTNPKTSQTIAHELGNYNQEMIRLFLEALTEIDLLTKHNDTYVNSTLANTYLVCDSSYYMKFTLKKMKENANHWSQLSIILKNGPIIQNRQDIFNDDWLISIAEWAQAGSIANALNVISNHMEPKKWTRLLDLGGGHGLYAIAFTALNPQLETYVFDLPHVAPIINKYIQLYNAKNVHIIPGNFYKDNIGKDYDIIFSSYNQSCSDPTLIATMVQALKPGGYIILRRFKDSTREGAIKILDWNLLSFEGKKIGSKPHSSDNIIDKKTYLNQLEKAGLTIVGTYPVDDMSEITFAHKPLSNGSNN
jgi:SAM-dependent methyltransferase